MPEWKANTGMIADRLLGGGSEVMGSVGTDLPALWELEGR